LEDSDIEGRTPLFYAVEEKKGELVQFALEHGANVNHQAHDGQTPLHAAAEVGSIPSLERLVEGGADVDAVDGEGRTPLHLAAIRGSRAHAAVLLEHDANVNATDEHGENVFHMLGGEDLKHDMRFYLRHGGDLHHADSAGNTPYLAAARRANLILIHRYFVRKADIAVKNEAGESALDLLQAQIRIPKPDRTWPPKIAARQKLLREAKNLINDQIGGVLESAAASGDLEMLAHVLGTYPDHLQKVTKERPSPLWAASTNGQLEAVKFLVDLGAHKPYRIKFGLMMNDVDRFHILHEAARLGHLEVLQYYIDELGIAWKEKDANGKTLREVSKDPAVLAYLDTLSTRKADDRLVAAEAS
jgi:ankyrin repeat protein